MSVPGTEARPCLGRTYTRALTSALKKCNAKTPSFGVFSPLVRAKPAAGWLRAQHQRPPWWGEPGRVHGGGGSSRRPWLGWCCSPAMWVTTTAGSALLPAGVESGMVAALRSCLHGFRG